MHSIRRVSAAAVILSVGTTSVGTTNVYGAQAVVDHIRFDRPSLAPIAYTQFCLKYPRECPTARMFRGGPIKLSADRKSEMTRVNQKVNAGIAPEANLQGLAGERWLIDPDRGDCNDYAVTKRHDLMARGWPARALLLSEVVARGGEHHLVLVARTQEGDFVLDNMTTKIVPWFKTPYQWVRVQLPGVARLWTTIVGRVA
jgi:predicted transglutaminase-like cysteine proteinase